MFPYPVLSLVGCLCAAAAIIQPRRVRALLPRPARRRAFTFASAGLTPRSVIVFTGRGGSSTSSVTAVVQDATDKASPVLFGNQVVSLRRATVMAGMTGVFRPSSVWSYKGRRLCDLCKPGDAGVSG